MLLHVAGHHGDVGAYANGHAHAASRACASPAVLLLQAIPLSLIIFVLFPRVQGPLWGMPQDAYASSGLTDTMAPGSMSKLSLVRCRGIPRHFQRQGAVARADVLARAGAVGFRRHHLETRAQRHLATPHAHRCKHAGGLHGHAGTAQQTLAVRTGYADKTFHSGRSRPGFPGAQQSAGECAHSL